MAIAAPTATRAVFCSSSRRTPGPISTVAGHLRTGIVSSSASMIAFVTRAATTDMGPGVRRDDERSGHRVSQDRVKRNEWRGVRNE
ncbi:MAG: hypothetical protein ACREO8_00900 [Luteimonas sp.]